MSFNADKKREHEQLAEKALTNKEYAKAFFHTAKAADFGFNLAEQSEGKLARAYLKDACDLLEIATKLKERARKQDKESPKGKDDSSKTKTSDQQGEDQVEESRWKLRAKPNIKLDDVAGLEKVKEQIRLRMILPYKYPEKSKKHDLKIGGGILMYGPPGTGKTFIARATAGELDAVFYAIKPSEIMSKWVGEAEARIRELFEEARKNPLSVIFIDEVESLVPARASSNSTVMQRVVPQFLAELEGIDTADANPILFMGATNEPWLIDPAMMRPGRFDVRVHVGLPDIESRKKILSSCFGETNAFVDDSTLAMIGDKTEGYSGADLRAVALLAKQKGFLKDISEEDFSGYDTTLLEECIQEITPSVSKKALSKYEKWRDEQK